MKIPVTRQDIEQREWQQLAPFAQKVSQSAGREHSEEAHPYRTAFQRDRSRIIHCRAFRRLQYKTQVFLNGTGDHLRTRLTHTMEVASVARTIAQALGLNTDLVEAIALAHDLGHAPFGHAGEEELNALMADHGGFEHNAQSLRIVEWIEDQNADFAGLNLSYEVRDGLKKHEAERSHPVLGEFRSPSLEAQVADLSDEIAYYSHDLEDGLVHGLLCVDQLESVEAWAVAAQRVRSEMKGIGGGRQFYSRVIRSLIDSQVRDVIESAIATIQEQGLDSPEKVQRSPLKVIQYSPARRETNHQLRTFLYDNLYFHPDISQANDHGRRQIARAFRHYLAHPEKMGQTTSRRLEKEGLHRTVCDYISGMTDRYISEMGSM